MSDLGHLLASAREKQGISLEALEARTRIRRRYLEAMEAGEFQSLPGPAYVRGFLRLYARECGLDADELVRAYSHAEVDLTDPATRGGRQRVGGHVREHLRFVHGPWFWPIVVALVIVAVMLTVWRWANPRDESPTPPPPLGLVPDMPEAADAEAQEDAESEVVGGTAPPEEEFYPGRARDLPIGSE